MFEQSRRNRASEASGLFSGHINRLCPSVLPICFVLRTLLDSRYVAMGCLDLAVSEMLYTQHDWSELIPSPSIYNGVTAIGLIFTYFPHAHVRAEGMSTGAILKRIDFLGGFLSITGLALLYEFSTA